MSVKRGNKPWQNPTLSHVHLSVSIGITKGHRNSSVANLAKQQHGLCGSQAIIIFVEKSWTLLCVMARKEKSFLHQVVLNSQFWKWISYPLEIQSFCIPVEGARSMDPWGFLCRLLCSGMSHWGPCQAHPGCDSGRHLGLKHWSCSTLCSGRGGIHLHPENLCFYWFLNIAVSEHKKRYFMKDFFCLGFAVSVRRSQLWN